MEVVSPGEQNRKHDYEDKRAEYADAGIPEYWIVDPEKRVIVVLALGNDKTYAIHGEFKSGERAGSLLLQGFAVDVEQALKGGV